jgi:Flp pilus assembly protein TadG
VRRRIRSDRGFAILEAALALPLLMLAGVGVVEFGRAYQTSQVLTKAAREGARVAVLPDSAAGAVDAKVRQYLQMGGLTSDGTVGVTTAAVAADRVVKAPGSEVTISYPFQFVVLQPVAQLLVSGSMVDSPITVTATSVMRNETGS